MECEINQSYSSRLVDSVFFFFIYSLEDLFSFIRRKIIGRKVDPRRWGDTWREAPRFLGGGSQWFMDRWNRGWMHDLWRSHREKHELCSEADLLEALNEPGATVLKYAELVFIESSRKQKSNTLERVFYDYDVIFTSGEFLGWLKMESTFFWQKVRLCKADSYRTNGIRIRKSGFKRSEWFNVAISYQEENSSAYERIVAVGLVTRTNLDKHCYESELGNRCSKSWYWRKPTGWRMVHGRIYDFLTVSSVSFLLSRVIEIYLPSRAFMFKSSSPQISIKLICLWRNRIILRLLKKSFFHSNIYFVWYSIVGCMKISDRIVAFLYFCKYLHFVEKKGQEMRVNLIVDFVS